MSRHIIKSFLAHHKVRVVIRMTIGWLFIFLGILGLFLPILQGILFIAVGIALLADHIPLFGKIRNYIYKRFPKLKRLVRKEHARLRLLHRRLRHKHEAKLKEIATESSNDKIMKKKNFFKWILITLATASLIIIPFMIYGERIDAWTEQLIESSQYNKGVVALILGSLLGSDILLPVPSSIASTACGMLLGIIMGSLVSLAGMIVSCVIGYYLAAKLGQPFVTKMVGDQSMNHFTELQQKYGNWVVVITRPVPVLAEIAVLAAGLGRIPFRHFFILSTLANLVDLDAEYLSSDGYGIIVSGLSREKAVRLSQAINAQGVAVEVVDELDLVALPNPKVLRRIDCFSDGLVLYDTLGRPETIDWCHIVMVSAGFVTASEAKRNEKTKIVMRGTGVQGGSVPVIISEISTQREQKSRLLLEIFLDVAPGRVQLYAHKGQYNYLGARLQPRYMNNFAILVQDLTDFASNAMLNRGANSLQSDNTVTFLYPTKHAYEEELIWLFWRMKHMQV